jgi:DNA polymerase-4
MGINTVGDLQAHGEEALVDRFGTRMGRYLKARSFFFDESPVEAVGAAKSRSNETTFPQDVSEMAELESTLVRLAEGLCEHLQRREVAGRTIGIKVRLDDWTNVTRARTLPERTNERDTVVAIALELLRAYDPPRPVRLLGVRVAGFEEPAAPAPVDDGLQLALPL